MAKLKQVIMQGDSDWGDVVDFGVTVSLRTDEGKGYYVEFSEGEPEDMTLGRDLGSAYDIYKMVKFAYQLGRDGVEMEFEEVIENEDEY